MIAEAAATLFEDELGNELDYFLRARLHALGTAASRGRLLVEALLIDARSEDRELEPTQVDLGDLVGDALTLLADRSEARSPRIVVAPMPTITTDPQFVSVIVRNLVGNAVKWGSPEGNIRIEADREPTAWRLSVISAGPVIDPKDVGRLLRPFERGRDVHHVGSGLGLAICGRLVERLGGTLGFAPEPGVGNRFFVRLPAQAASRHSAEGPAIAAGEEPSPAVAC